MSIYTGGAWFARIVAACFSWNPGGIGHTSEKASTGIQAIFVRGAVFARSTRAPSLTAGEKR